MRVLDPTKPPTESSDLVSSVRRRRLAAASLAATSVLAFSACGTNFSAQTNKVYQPAVGANVRGDVDSLNTLLVGNQDGSATISASLVNNLDEDQTISSITVTTLNDLPLRVRSSKVLLPLPPGQLTTLGRAKDAGAFTVISGATPGAYVKVTYTFSTSHELTVEAPVVARTAEYDSIVSGEGSAE